MKKIVIVLGTIFSFVSLSAALLSANAREVIVENQDQYNETVKTLEAGDEIILADGTWRDFEILFEGEGAKNAPITLRAQTKGAVILSGQSNLRMAGEHLVVSGLVFKNGYTPTSEVISFRSSKDKLANNSRVTEVVIDNFNNPERYENDFWVMMYGKNNRFDHNHLVGKKNKGVTMAVKLNSEASQENNHRIDHNYFGPRPVLGSNGGETLRIGTSAYSLTDSKTIVENNFFDRCDGELEIISIKSGKNIVRNNSFYESRGTLTMRHGNDNLITENVFFGNGVDHTGGIRVINKRQTITNNYMEGLKGYRFGGAFVVMNGVPNSPINRYHQVDGAKIDNNTIVNSDHIQLAAGSDVERSAVPINSSFSHNLVYHKDGNDVFTVYDDISGITFEDNVSHAVKEPTVKNGFVFQKFKMKRAANGLLYPRDSKLEGEGISKDLKVTAREDTGVDWYSKDNNAVAFGEGTTTKVAPGDDTLTDAVNASKPGDILVLSKGGYAVSKNIIIKHTLTIKGASTKEKPEVSFFKPSLFDIADGGSLRIEGLFITGKSSPDNVGNDVIRTSKYSMLNNYRLHIINTDISDLDVNRVFDVVEVSKSTMADEILIENSTFTNISGSVLKLNKETDDFGIFNADYVIIKDSKFEKIGEEVVNMYRGGRDESTFGPHLDMTGSEIIDAGHATRNKSKSSIMLHGVQVTSIDDNKFNKSAGLNVEHTVSEPVTKIIDNNFDATPGPAVVELVSEKKDTATIKGNKVTGEVE